MDQIGPEGYAQLASQQASSDIRSHAVLLRVLEVRVGVLEAKLNALAEAIVLIGEGAKTATEEIQKLAERMPRA